MDFTGGREFYMLQAIRKVTAQELLKLGINGTLQHS
jgi:hypothetical protein